MKFNPFCMCCAVSKQEQNIRSFQDMDKKVEYMKKVMDRMANIAEEDCAPSVSVELKKMFRDFWEQPMEDYTSVKKKYNQLMLDMEASLEETIRNSEDPLETALLYARIGNYTGQSSDRKIQFPAHLVDLFDHIIIQIIYIQPGAHTVLQAQL